MKLRGWFRVTYPEPPFGLRVDDRVRITVDCAGWNEETNTNFKVVEGSTGTVIGPSLITGMWNIELDDGKGFTAMGPKQLTVIS